MKKTSRYENFLKKTLITAGAVLIFILNSLWHSGEISAIPKILQNPQLQVFTMIVAAILLEALPFILIGALISGIMEVLIPGEKIQKIFSGNSFLHTIGSPFLGMFFPVCSCGNVVLAKRLLKKGAAPSGVITYMLAAPIINPVTILATFLAFSASKEVVLGRILIAFAVSVITPFILKRFLKEGILKERTGEIYCEENHKSFSKIEKIFHHAEVDFLIMGKYLVLGAIIAALFQTFVPRAAFLSLANNKILAVFLMEALGISLSLCSFADAFVASSFTNLPVVSKIIFMVAGPMANITVAILYFGTFKKKFVIRLLLAVFFAALILGFAGAAVTGG
ncbi:MAG: permease [Candidatus Omnitrophica bacterium]|nr:permease [Candidatus Omnitrophota bacterium]